MDRTDSHSTDPELDELFGRLRASPESPAVGQTALGLPARVAARLREDRDGSARSYLRWAMGLAPLTAACVALAALGEGDLQLGALADPQAAGWFILLFG